MYTASTFFFKTVHTSNSLTLRINIIINKVLIFHFIKHQFNQCNLGIIMQPIQQFAGTIIRIWREYFNRRR